jgi:hypothetical protein
MTKICKHHGPLPPEMVGKGNKCILCRRKWSMDSYIRHGHTWESQKLEVRKAKQKSPDRKKRPPSAINNMEENRQIWRERNIKKSLELKDHYVKRLMRKKGYDQSIITRETLDIEKAIIKIKRKAKEDE